MGDKPVTELAGIGDVLGTRLTEKGFDKVRHYWSNSARPIWGRIEKNLNEGLLFKWRLRKEIWAEL